MVCVVRVRQQINIATDNGCSNMSEELRNNERVSRSGEEDTGTRTMAAPINWDSRERKEGRLATRVEGNF